MPLPWPQPRKLKTEHATAPAVSPGARSTFSLASPCPVAPIPTRAELRRRRELVSGELRPPQLLPLAEMNAGELQLPVGGLRCPEDPRNRNPEALRRICCRRRLNAGVLAVV